MGAFDEAKAALQRQPVKWLVTGAAGFIGSHLVEALLNLEQHVVGLDNFATGHKSNLDDVAKRTGKKFERFSLIEGDTRDAAVCAAAVKGVQHVLHQAALGSVPRSMKDPRTTHDANVNGFVNVALAVKDAGLRLVYASSSSVYGDHAALPKREDVIGRPLSPYAASKRIAEVYADAFSNAYGMNVVGLRYFNVFGPRQDPNGPYAAVIPRWLAAMLKGEACVIHGDGSASRDFCHVSNVVQANLLSALATTKGALTCNVACGQQTSLLELHAMMLRMLRALRPDVADLRARHEGSREGDVQHSLASVERARAVLGYEPTQDMVKGMEETVRWWVERRSP